MKSVISFAIYVFLLMAGLTPHAEGQRVYEAYLSGGNEGHHPATTASGRIEAVLTGYTLEISGTFSNLTTPVDLSIGGGAHVHIGYAGEDGGVVFPLAADLEAGMTGGSFNASANTFDLTLAQMTALEERRYYVNIHTERYPAGEIRGQLVPAADRVLRVNLSGNHETPPVITDARGALVAELNNNELTITGSFSGLSSAYTASHIHLGFAGQPGGIVSALAPVLDQDERGGVYLAADNTVILNASQLERLNNRELYVNIHSANHMPGEIRGQIIPQADAVFHAFLSGIAETPPIDTEGTGSVIAELTGNELTLSGSFQGLSSPQTPGGAHIHIGFAGQSGGVIFPLTTSAEAGSLSGAFHPTANTFILGEEQLADLTDFRYYVNVHSQNFPPGEIRGQLLIDPHAYPSKAEIEIPDEDTIIIIEDDPGTEIGIEWTDALDPSGHPVVYIWQVALDEDFKSLLINTNTGTETAAEYTHGDFYEILENADIAVGDTLITYQRVIAGNGSFYSSGISKVIRFVRTSITNIDDPGVSVPRTTVLRQNYPNPFNPVTNIAFELPERASVTLIVYDITGREVARLINNEDTAAGSHNLQFSGGDLGSGMYYYRLSTNNGFTNTKRMILIK